MQVLRDSLEAAMKRRRLREEALRAFSDPEERDAFLRALQADLLHGRYAPGPYHMGSVPHQKDPNRHIEFDVLGLRQWIVERALYETLAAVYEPIFSPCSFAYRRSSGERRFFLAASDAIRQGSTWFACADVERFYYTIDIDALVSDIENFTSDAAAAGLVKRCMRGDERVGLPLGHVLSPFLSNVYLHPIDCSPSVQPVLRFADDYFLPRRTRDDATVALVVLENLLKSRGLVLSPSKRRIVPSPSPESLLSWTAE